MNKTNSIDTLLKNHNITAEEFLSTQGISTQIRSHLKKFTNFCRTHKPFTARMIELAFNTTYQQLGNNQQQKASHTANQIFANQQPEIAQLFFQPPPKPQNEQTEIEQVIEEVGIQTEAEKLFNNDSEEEQPAQERPIQITKEEMLSMALQILKNPQKNETCLGHLQKMFSFFIRHEPIPVLEYFQKHQQTLQLLLINLQFSSVSTLLAQLLTSQDKNKEYKYEGLKKKILQEVVENIFHHINQPQYFDGALIFLDEVLNATKQSYYQYFQDFKRISNYLVSNKVLSRFYDQLFKKSQSSFLNTSKFLQNLFIRINSETQDNRYYHKEQNQSTMLFQIDMFLNNVDQLINMTSTLHQFTSITKIHFLSFLQALLQTPQLKNTPFNLAGPSFIALFDAFKTQNNGGISKNKIYNIIHLLITHASEEQVTTLLTQQPNLYEHYFTSIKEANYSNTKNYNKNQTSAYDVSLITDLTRKKEPALQSVSKLLGKDFKRICKKYDTKIATFTNSSTLTLEDEEDKFQIFKSDENKRKEEDPNGTSQFGKNNITIPILHLPDRYSQKKGQNQEQSRASQPKQVVEVEEVVVLTNKLDKLRKNKDINIKKVIEEEQDFTSIPKEESKQTIKEQKLAVKEQKLREIPMLQLKTGVRDNFEKVRYFTRHLAIFA